MIAAIAHDPQVWILLFQTHPHSFAHQHCFLIHNQSSVRLLLSLFQSSYRNHWLKKISQFVRIFNDSIVHYSDRTILVCVVCIILSHSSMRCPSCMANGNMRPINLPLTFGTRSKRIPWFFRFLLGLLSQEIVARLQNHNPDIPTFKPFNTLAEASTDGTKNAAHDFGSTKYYFKKTPTSNSKSKMPNNFQ